MKRIKLLMIVCTVLLNTSLFAQWDSNWVSRYWKRHDIAIRESLRCWAREISVYKCKGYISEIANMETFLLIYKVPADNPNLVLRDAEDASNIGALMYRILLKRFKDFIGWRPDFEKILNKF